MVASQDFRGYNPHYEYDPPFERKVELVFIGIFVGTYISSVAVIGMRTLGHHVALAYPIPYFLYLYQDMGYCRNFQTLLQQKTFPCRLAKVIPDRDALTYLIVTYVSVCFCALILHDLIYRLWTGSPYSGVAYVPIKWQPHSLLYNLYTFVLVAMFLINFQMFAGAQLLVAFLIPMIWPLLLPVLGVAVAVILLLAKAFEDSPMISMESDDSVNGVKT